MLIFKPQNIRYMTNFSGSVGLLLVTLGNPILLVDFRYLEQAKRETKQNCCEVKLVTNSFFDDLTAILSKFAFKKIGFESEYLTYAKYKYLAEILQGIRLISVQNSVEIIRLIKDEDEIKKISEAAHIADRVFEKILDFIKPGLTEIEIAAEIEYLMRKFGAEKASFDTIVASGSNSAMPHAKSTGKKLEAGDFVKMDFGAMYQGYCSDMTRMVVLGSPDKKKREIYNLVLRAQKTALNKVKEGLCCREVDSIARDIISEAGYADNFGHNLGHGVGLEVHELPTIGPKSNDFLQSKMVFTIEPGVYIEGFGGVRIEDLVVLRDDGPEVLTKSPKELVEL